MEKDATASANRVPYGISGPFERSVYGSLRAFAKRLGLSKLQEPFQQILEGESAIDSELSELAENFINTHAARETI